MVIYQLVIALLPFHFIDATFFRVQFLHTFNPLNDPTLVCFFFYCPRTLRSTPALKAVRKKGIRFGEKLLPR